MLRPVLPQTRFECELSPIARHIVFAFSNISANVNLFHCSSTYVLTVNFVYRVIFRFLMSIIIAIINDTGYFIRISWLAEINVVSATLNAKINQHCTLQINTISSHIATLKVIRRWIYQCPIPINVACSCVRTRPVFLWNILVKNQDVNCAKFSNCGRILQPKYVKHVCKLFQLLGDEPPAQTPLGTSVPKPAGL